MSCALLLAGCGGEGGVEAMMQTLREGDAEAQRSAAESLARLEQGEDQTEAVALLADAAGDDDADVRRLSIYALGELGAAAEAALPPLRAALQDSQKNVRWAAAHAVARVDPAEPLAAEVLIEAFKQGDLRAVISLGLLRGPAAQRAAPLLADALNSPQTLIRLKAAESLGQLGEAARPLLPALQRAAKDDDLGVQQAAQQAIAKIEESTR